MKLVPDIASNRWPVDVGVGRGVDGIPIRVDAHRALGNSVVPQVSEVIGWIVRELATED